MTQCNSCGHDVPSESRFCPSCGAEKTALSTRPSANPYQVSEAVIDARHVDPTPEEAGESSDYNVRYGVGATISEMFGIWSDSLGRLILISLIPMVPTVVAVIALIVVMVVSVATDFSSLFSNFSANDLPRFMESLNNMGLFVAIFGVVVLLIIVFTIPSITGQFKIMDEKKRLGYHRIGIWQAYWSSFRYTLPLIGFAVLAYIVLLVAMLPVLLLSKIAAPVGVIYMISLTVVSVVVGLRFLMVLPLMVVEGLSLFAAISRSWQMTIGRTWSLVGIMLVMFLVMIGMFVVLMILNLIPVLGQLVNMFAQLLITPLQMSLIFAIYAGLKSPQSSF